MTNRLARLGRRHWPYPEATLTYLAVRLVTLIGVAIADPLAHKSVTNMLSKWDGEWYLKALYWGWPSHVAPGVDHAAQTTLAFFPLLPELIKVLSDVTFIAPSIVGLLVSGLSGLTALWAVAALTREYAGPQVARRTAMLFALFPGGAIFSLIYCEGLLLTFVAASLLMLLRRRWLLAGLLGALATITSPAGLPLLVAAGWACATAIVRRREWRSVVAPLVSSLGFLGWMGYLAVHTGQWNAWRLTEQRGWRSYPSLRYPLHLIANFLFDPRRPNLQDDMLLVGLLVTLVMLWWTWRTHQPGPVLAYATSAVLIFAISAPVGLRPRFTLIAFPLLAGVAARFEGRAFRRILIVSGILLVVNAAELIGSWAIFP